MLLPYSWPIVVVLGAALYLLYRSGLMVTKRLAAILFVFRPGRDQDRVRLDTCTGWVRHVARLRGARSYELILDCQLSRGSAAVSLLDRDKRPLLKLDRQAPIGRASLEGNGRHYLHWEFESAAGQCELRWREIETRGR